MNKRFNLKFINWIVICGNFYYFLFLLNRCIRNYFLIDLKFKGRKNIESNLWGYLCYFEGNKEFWVIVKVWIVNKKINKGYWE